MILRQKRAKKKVMDCSKWDKQAANESLVLAEQEEILECGSTVFLFDGLRIAHIIGELCADIWKVCRKSGCPT